MEDHLLKNIWLDFCAEMEQGKSCAAQFSEAERDGLPYASTFYLGPDGSGRFALSLDDYAITWEQEKIAKFDESRSGIPYVADIGTTYQSKTSMQNLSWNVELKNGERKREYDFDHLGVLIGLLVRTDTDLLQVGVTSGFLWYDEIPFVCYTDETKDAFHLDFHYKGTFSVPEMDVKMFIPRYHYGTIKEKVHTKRRCHHEKIPFIHDPAILPAADRLR